MSEMNVAAIVARLRTAGALKVVADSVDPVFEAAKLLGAAGSGAVLLENVRGAKVLANIMPERRALANVLGVSVERFLPELSAIIAGTSGRAGGLSRTPEVYGEVEIPRSEWGRLPILTYFACDGGPYLTAGVWVVQDPKLGRNLCYHRLMMTGDAGGTVRVVERRGTHTAIQNSGGKLDAAILISPPANVLFAGALSPAPEVDEMEIAARFGPLEMLRCKTVDLEVPAATEMVIEGRFTGDMGTEGPFVDITGTVDILRRQPVFEITRVACRKDPLHYTIVPAGADHKTLMGIPKEMDIYREVGAVAKVVDVSITPGGASWLHAVVKISKNGPDDGRRAIAAAFKGHKSLKHCVVVDDDIDIFNPLEVEWAVATRFQADKDLVVFDNLPGSSLDPSNLNMAGEGSRGAKMGLDATRPAGIDPKHFKRFD